jgi:hypothetical protein
LKLQEGIFGSFGHAEFENNLSWNLDGLTSGWIAAHARWAVDFN